MGKNAAVSSAALLTIQLGEANHWRTKSWRNDTQTLILMKHWSSTLTQNEFDWLLAAGSFGHLPGVRHTANLAWGSISIIIREVFPPNLLTSQHNKSPPTIAGAVPSTVGEMLDKVITMLQGFFKSTAVFNEKLVYLLFNQCLYLHALYLTQQTNWLIILALWLVTPARSLFSPWCAGFRNLCWGWTAGYTKPISPDRNLISPSLSNLPSLAW